MTLKVGDLVEIIDAPGFVNPHCRKYIGHVGKIIGWDGNRYRYVEGATAATNGRECTHHISTLRRIDPPSKDDSAPRTDHTPCEPEFAEWLKKLGARVGV